MNELETQKLAACKATMQLVADEAKLGYKGGPSIMGYITVSERVEVRLEWLGRYSWNSQLIVRLSVSGKDVGWNMRRELERKYRKLVGDPVKDKAKILDLIKEAGKCEALLKEHAASVKAAEAAQLADRAAVSELVKEFEAKTGLKLFENTWGHGSADLYGLREQDLEPINEIRLTKDTAKIEIRVPVHLAAKLVNAIRDLAKEGQP